MIKNIWNTFKSPPPAPRIQNPEEVKSLYRYWRIRIMYSTIIGYGLFYFARKNISIALPAIGKDLSLSNTELGVFNSLLYITYGWGKFINGVLGDKANPRYFMAFGLTASAVMNIFFGLSSAFWFLAVFWGLNGWFQSMGFPPCGKLLANWYSSSERAFKWSIWHISHSVGGMVIAILAGYLIQRYGWRTAFYIPAALCILTALFLYNRLRDNPPTLGLPNIAEYHNDIELDKHGAEVTEEPESIKRTLWDRVLTNKFIWVISLMNLFVYVVRFGTFDWATKFLVEQKGSNIAKAGFVVSMLEMAGIASPLLVGYISDKMGRRSPICFVCFLGTIVGLMMFYYVPAGHPYIDALSLLIVGFFVYGPQFLIAPFATDFASRKAASTAVGLTGIFGYAGATLSSMGTGYFLDHYGWKGGFVFWMVCALLGAVLAAILWNVSPIKHRNNKN